MQNSLFVIPPVWSDIPIKGVKARSRPMGEIEFEIDGHVTSSKDDMVRIKDKEIRIVRKIFTSYGGITSFAVMPMEDFQTVDSKNLSFPPDVFVIKKDDKKLKRILESNTP